MGESISDPESTQESDSPFGFCDNCNCAKDFLNAPFSSSISGCKCIDPGLRD
jgi:hypothetical protein